MQHLLTDSKIRSAAPTEKTNRMFDGGGLYLEISPAGGKWWRLKYRFAGKEKRVSLGTYPTITLAMARERALVARRQVAEGVDPSEAKKTAKQAIFGRADADTFEVVAREWHKSIYVDRVSEGQAGRVLARLENYVFPALRATLPRDVTAVQVLAIGKRIESRGTIETAHKTLQAIGQVMRYAVATGRADRDVTRDLKGALKPFRHEHMPAILDPQRIGEMLRAIDGYEGSYHVRAALKLAPLTFVRPSELRAARWAEFDLDAALWRIPAERMKGSKEHKSRRENDHFVPLSRQAVEIVRDLFDVTGHLETLFPSNRGRGRVMSDMTVNAALRRLGYAADEMTGHGFRAIARTRLVETLDWDEAIVEAQLAHRVRDALGRAYNRTTFVEKRREMMQQWGDYLDQLRVLPPAPPSAQGVHNDQSMTRQ